MKTENLTKKNLKEFIPELQDKIIEGTIIALEESSDNN